jgi:hypothetical protein
MTFIPYTWMIHTHTDAYTLRLTSHSISLLPSSSTPTNSQLSSNHLKYITAQNDNPNDQEPYTLDIHISFFFFFVKKRSSSLPPSLMLQYVPLFTPIFYSSLGVYDYHRFICTAPSFFVASFLSYFNDWSLFR